MQSSSAGLWPSKWNMELVVKQPHVMFLRRTVCSVWSAGKGLRVSLGVTTGGKHD
jgi:hypothetical protein